jgi:hypothetical protein
MARKLIEGQTLGVVAGTVPDLTAVVTLPAPDGGAVYRDDQNGDELVFTNPSVLLNRDPITAHTFKLFMRGADVPGGEVELTSVLSPGDAVATVAALASGPATPAFPLVGDQRYELEMQQVVVTTAPEFVTSFLDNHSPLDKLKVVKSVPGTLVSLFDDQADLVIEVPDEATAREIQFDGTGGLLSLGTHIVNRDSVTHTMTLLFSPDGGVTEFVLASVAVPTLDTLQNALGTAMVETLNLIRNAAGAKGQFIIRDATAVTTTSPVALVAFTDFA